MAGSRFLEDQLGSRYKVAMVLERETHMEKELSQSRSDQHWTLAREKMDRSWETLTHQERSLEERGEHYYS